jgi:hypothetical protein
MPTNRAVLLARLDEEALVTRGISEKEQVLQGVRKEILLSYYNGQENDGLM